MSENAQTKRGKVEVEVTVYGDESEQRLQYTDLRIRTSPVEEKSRVLRQLATKQGAHVSSSSFTRDRNGRESATVWLRLPMRSYASVMQSLGSLGKIEDLTVKREERPATTDLENAPAEISIEIYSPGNLVSGESGLLATVRNTIGQGVVALTWSLRMIGVAIAFLLPWVLLISIAVALIRRARRIRGQ